MVLDQSSGECNVRGSVLERTRHCCCIGGLLPRQPCHPEAVGSQYHIAGVGLDGGRAVQPNIR